VRELVSSSGESIWSADSPEEVVQSLQRQIDALMAGGKGDRLELSVLFAPTGALQEISMANDWSDEYLARAASFDDCMKAVERG
jgi:hypothetical protein